MLDRKPKSTAVTRLRRVRNILANPQVSLVVDHYEEDWHRLWYVLVLWAGTGSWTPGTNGRRRRNHSGVKYAQYRRDRTCSRKLDNQAQEHERFDPWSLLPE